MLLSFSFVEINSEGLKASFSEKRKIDFRPAITGSNIDVGIYHQSQILFEAIRLVVGGSATAFGFDTLGGGGSQQTTSTGEGREMRKTGRWLIYSGFQCS